MSDLGNAVASRRVVLGAAVAAGAATALGSASTAFATNVSGGVTQYSIDAVAKRLDDQLIALRRDIHRHPETAGEEGRTAAVVAERLRTAGLTVSTDVGGHGVVGVLAGVRRGRTVAYRADIDAVPPEDQIDGGTTAAHVCGHDLHTAIGIGIAEVLARLRNRLSGRIVFVFQPAEEALTGAEAMIDDGVLRQTRPEEIHALHCGPFPVGQFVVTPGTGLPGQDHSIITLSGPDAATQAPQLITDIGGLATVAPPETSADLERLVEDIQTPHGPLTEFITIQARAAQPDAGGRIEVQTSSRCWPEERYTEVRDEISAIADGYDGTQVTFPAEPFPAMVCPVGDGRAVRRHLSNVLGRDKARTVHAAIPFSGEDFALFLDRIPGTYTFLGVRAPGTDITTSYPHFGSFDPDERAIGYGVRAMAGWLAERSARSTRA